MSDNVWREKSGHQPNVKWSKKKKIKKMKEHWRIRFLKKSPHMLGYDNLVSRPSLEIDTILGSLIKYKNTVGGSQVWEWNFNSNKKKWQQEQEDCLMLPVVDSVLAHKTTD